MIGKNGNEGYGFGMMRVPIKKNRLILKAAGLLCYGIILYLLFLIVTFPKEKVQRWYFTQLQTLTRTDMTVGESRFTFPMGAEWKRITFTPAGRETPRFVLDQLNVDFLILSFLKGDVDARFNLRGYGGDIRGVVGSDRKGSNPSYSVVAEGNEIDLKQFPWKKEITLEGKIRFQTEYRWEERNPVRGKGYLNVEGTGISGRGLSFSGISLPEMTLYKMNGHGLIREGSVQVDRLTVTGSLADLNGTGTLLLDLPLQKSLLNLSMKLTPKEALNKVIPLTILSPNSRVGAPMDLFMKGTLRDPVFTLTGAPS